MLKVNQVLKALALPVLMSVTSHAGAQNHAWQASPSHSPGANQQTPYSLYNNHSYYYHGQQPYYSPYYSQYDYSQQSRNRLPNQTPHKANNRGMQGWQNWFKNQFQNGSWQQGDGNVFQDANGFYKLMGNGRTKWKFYFDVDFQAEMDAWLQGNGQAKNRQNNQWNGNTQQGVNGAGRPNWNQQGGYGNQYQPHSIYYPSYPSYAR